MAIIFSFSNKFVLIPIFEIVKYNSEPYIFIMLRLSIILHVHIGIDTVIFSELLGCRYDIIDMFRVIHCVPLLTSPPFFLLQ